MPARENEILPEDGFAGALVGRVRGPDGPSVVVVRADGIVDISRAAATIPSTAPHRTAHSV